MIVPFSDPKQPICPEHYFFGTKRYHYFHLPSGPFHWAKFKKILTADPELWGLALFGPKMVHLPQTRCFGKIINTILIYPLPILKHFSSRSRVMRMRNFWAQNGPFPQMRIFFRKPVNEPCFFHSCLSTCQKSKSDINLLVKYWRLKNTEISLAESHFWL